MTDDEIEPYTTSDTPFAAYLNFRGMELLSTTPDKYDRKRQAFVFIDVPERPQYEQDWDNDLGGFRSYYKALKTVQHALHPARKR